MNSLVQQYIEKSTDMTLEENETRCYEYYNDDELDTSVYDHIRGMIQELY